jgi:hypothetical protein
MQSSNTDIFKLYIRRTFEYGTNDDIIDFFNKYQIESIKIPGEGRIYYHIYDENDFYVCKFSFELNDDTKHGDIFNVFTFYPIDRLIAYYIEVKYGYS